MWKCLAEYKEKFEIKSENYFHDFGVNLADTNIFFLLIKIL
jgi:hypothetical protein